MIKIRTLIALLAFVAYVRSDNHYIDDCLSPGNEPTLAYDQEISKDGINLHYQEETVRIPKSGFTPGIITCITVTNLESDENGGYPRILTGGVGYDYVSIYFKSQVGKGFDFQVSVYYDNSPPTARSDLADY